MTHIHFLRLCTVALLLASGILNAQEFPLMLSTTVNPPYTANYVQYFQNPGQVSVLVHNNFPGAVTREIYLAGSITTFDGTIAVTVEGGQPWNAPPLTIPVGFSSLSGTDLEPFISNSAGLLDYQGISEEDIRIGLLPEGQYQLCLQAFDYFTNEPLSAGAPSDGCSNYFTITYPPPPQLLSPACGATVDGIQPQTVLFNWILPSGPPMGAAVQYHFKLVLLPEGDMIDPLSALETSNDPVWEDDVMTPQVLYTQLMPALLSGRRYAWYVRAVDINAQQVFQNNGWSEPCTFVWSGAGAFTLAYPMVNDTLPWDFLPIVTRFDPYRGDITQFTSELTLIHVGGEQENYEREIVWASGPQVSQQAVLGIPVTEDQARHINIYKRPGEPGVMYFESGEEHVLSAEITLSPDNGDPIVGHIDGGFASGMGVPRMISPANDAQLARNGGDPAVIGYAPVPLRFKTSEPPARLLPPFRIIQNVDGQSSQTDGNIYQRWRLDVSKSTDFIVRDSTTSSRVGQLLNLLEEGCDEPCMVAQLYKDVEFNFTPDADGTYYWRVVWLTDPNSEFGEHYRASPTYRFTIGEGTGEGSEGEITTEEEEIPPAQCLAESRRTPTPIAQRVAVNSTQVGDTVQVGLFKMTVSTISHSGDMANGVGLIDVPVMRAQLRVQFNGVRINAQKRLYMGDVTGLYDNAGVIPAAWVQGTSLAAGFDTQNAEALDTYLNTAGRLVSQFAGSMPMGLPIGIDKQTEAGRVVIGILGVQFTDTIARLNAGMALPMYELGETVGLGNMAIPFHPGGIGDVTEEATLYLLGDLNIPIGADTLKFKGARFTEGFTTVQDSGTFVAWDCQGFRAVTFDLEYRFDREKLREDLPSGEDGPQKVIGSLRVRTGRAGIMGRLDMNTPFHLAHAKGWGFDVQEAWLDLASYVNPPNLYMPAHHLMNSEYFDEAGTVDVAWTGVFVKRAMLRLPTTIQRFEGVGRTTAQVDNLVYGFGEGLSASFKIANILDTDEGTLDGWGFSLDTLQADIALNSFVQGGFKGRIHMPFSDTLLVYSGMIQHQPTTHDLRMEFLLHPDGTLNVPMYVGQMQLMETSTIRAILGDSNTGNSATAELDGKLSIDMSMPEGVKLNFRDIAFQNLTFQTKAPYTNIDDNGVFSLASPQKYMGMEDELTDGEEGENKAGGFPVSITRVTTERRNSEGATMAGIGFDINLDLSGATNIFVATTRIAVLGELNTEALHKWGHHSVELDSIGVTGETGAVKIKGGLRWYHDDPVYGNGINGMVNAWFMKGALQVRAAAQFGTVNNMRYWYADAMMAKENGFSPGQPFNIYGFGGGAWYHMKRTTALPNALQVTQATLAHQDDEEYEPGLTLTSIRFVPDAAINFGFQATIIFGDGASGRAYNGDLTAGMSFSESGGVSTAFLNGNVYMMSERRDDRERDYMPIHGTAAISYDFPNDVFQANFQVFVALRAGMVTGTGTNNLAGAAEILITPDTWHFFVGTPQTPIGLKFIGLFDTKAYFMVGKDLPDPLPPDSAAVMALMGEQEFNWPGGVGQAYGIAFGARADLDQKFDFYLLRMQLQAGLGFDLVFVSSDNMTCTDISDPGIAGFYATGQVYAYLAGSVSLHVDVWFAEGDFEVLSLAAAAVLQGGFADPSWVRGEVGGRINILNGLVTGDFNFPFSAGHPCTDYGAGALAGLDPIGDITPRNGDGIASGTTAVDVGTNCEVALNMRLDTPFQLKEYRSNGSTYWRKFRLRLENVSLKKGGAEQATGEEFSAAKDQILVTPSRYLDPRTTYTFSVALYVEEWLDAKHEIVPGSYPPRYQDTPAGWSIAMNDGELAKWDSTVTFRTGDGLKELREQDLDYTYPFIGQRYVLQDECRAAIIQCKADLSGQEMIFGPAAEGRTRVYKIMLTPHLGGNTIICPATVYRLANDASNNGGDAVKTTITYTLPQLQNSTQYVAQLIYRDSLLNSGGRFGLPGMTMDMGEMSVATASTSSEQGGMVNVNTRKLSGYSVRQNEKLLFSYQFVTSRYNTIATKVATLTSVATHVESDGAVPPREMLRPGFAGEGFDVFDVLGYRSSVQGSSFTLPPLIRLDDALIDTWSNQWSKPVLYDYYAQLKARGCSNLDLQRSMGTNSFGLPSISDSPDPIGMPPYRTVAWRVNNPTTQPLNSTETAPPPANGPGSMIAGGGPLEVSEGGGINMGNVRLDQKTSYWVRDDHKRLQTITADVIAKCGPLGSTGSGMIEPLRSMVVRYQNSGYKRPYRGNYGVRFSFEPPPTCKPFLDSGQSSPALSSGTALFNYTSGPAGPLPSTGTGGLSGGIQTAP